MSDVDFRSGDVALEAPKAVPEASDVASHWKTTGSVLVNSVQAVQNASIPTEQWSGQTADAVVAEIQKREVRSHFLLRSSQVLRVP